MQDRTVRQRLVILFFALLAVTLIGAIALYFTLAYPTAVSWALLWTLFAFLTFCFFALQWEGSNTGSKDSPVRLLLGVAGTQIGLAALYLLGYLLDPQRWSILTIPLVSLFIALLYLLLFGGLWWREHSVGNLALAGKNLKLALIASIIIIYAFGFVMLRLIP